MQWIVAAIGRMSGAFGTGWLHRARKQSPKCDAAPEDGFEPVYRFAQADGRLTLLLDPRSRRFALAARGCPLVMYPIERVQLVTVERNGTRMKMSGLGRGTTVAEAAVRGSAMPIERVFGAILCGAPISRLALRILTDEPQGSSHEIVFFASQKGVPTSNHELMLAAMELDEWFGRFQSEICRKTSHPSVTPASKAGPHSPEGPAATIGAVMGSDHAHYAQRSRARSRD